MPAREMYFTFNKDIELNEKNVKELKEMLLDYIPDKKEIQALKDAFCTEEFDKNFFKFFIKEIKEFNSVSVDRNERSSRNEKENAIYGFIYDVIGNESDKPTTLLGFKYLYVQWDYEGCGHDDHYYLTFASEEKEIKKFTKEAEEAIKKLNSIGVKAKLVIE